MRFWINRHPDADGGAAPAPATPAAPEQSPLSPPTTPLQQAVADARARIAANEALTPAPPQERLPDGTFAPAPGTPPEAPPPGEAPPAEEAKPDAVNPLVVEVPGRRPEDPPDIYEAATPEQAERLRQLVNGYQRADAIKQQEFRLRADREQLQEITARLEFDPEGFLFDQIPQERAASVALQVLLQPEVWGQVNDVLLELLESDDKRELVRVSLENQRLKNKEESQTRIAVQRESAQNAHVIKSAIAMMIPDTLPEADQVALYNACQADVVAYAERLRLNTMDPRDVPLVIAARLRAGGVDPVQAASIFQRAAGQPRSGTGKGRAPANGRPATPAPTGKDFVAANAAARAAATVAPAGAGAASAAGTGQPPAGQSLEERIAWGRQNLKFTSG